MSAKKVRVLIVEDSLVMRQLLAHVLGADPGIEVVGQAASGAEALELLERTNPDVVTMDVNMPRMNGFEVTRHIMSSRPCPVVIVSASWEPGEVATTFGAVEAGAVAAVGKPRGPGHPGHEEDARKLVATVKAMSEVKVVRRWAHPPPAGGRAVAAPPPVRAAPDKAIRIVAVGSSTGGPPVLRTILADLPPDFPVPVVIVQHIAAGFVQGLADWLGQGCALGVSVAAHGEDLAAGHAYLAPDGFHTGVGRDLRVRLSTGAAGDGLRPSVAHLFASVADSFGGAAAAVLLTGMGRDGAEELLLLRRKGAVTIAQDRESSVVFGMPGEAVRIGAAAYVMGPERIGALLAGLQHGKDLYSL